MVAGVGVLRRYHLAEAPQVMVHVADLGMACCAVEFAAAVSRGLLIESRDIPTMDPASSSRHVLIVSGTVTHALGPSVEQAWLSLPEPRAALAYGACTISGGPYWDSDSVVPGIDTIIPTDLYVAGCPPTPENLLSALVQLQKRVETEGLEAVKERHRDLKTA